MSFASCFQANEFNLPTAANPNPIGTVINVPLPTQVGSAGFVTGAPGSQQLLTGLIPSGLFILPTGTWIYQGVTLVQVVTAADAFIDTQMNVQYPAGVNTIAKSNNGYNAPAAADFAATPQLSGVIVSDGVSALSVTLECDTANGGNWLFGDQANVLMTQQLVRVA